MLNFINKIIVKRRSLVFEEIELTRVLEVINKHKDPWFISRPNMSIGNCGWKDETKWFVHFDTSKSAWNKIIKDLEVIRVWQNRDIPRKCTGKIYSTD